MKRTIVALLIGGMVFGTILGLAATLSVNGGTIQAGEDNDLRCTTNANVDGWGLETDTNMVSYVRIFINANCEGSDMFIKFTQDGTVIADAKLTLDGSGSTGNVPLTAVGWGDTTPVPQDASDITDIHIWIEGSGGTPNDP